MKEIVIMSGKGGTGKTSFTAALGVLAGKQAIVADCDVDAANLHLLYQPEILEDHNFLSGKLAVIDYDTCIDCGVCRDKCAFDAIDLTDGKYVINEISCEGCAVCSYLCPEHSIEMKDNHAGKWFISKSRFGTWMVHAHLDIGQDNSGKLVSKVKDEAKKLAKKNEIPFLLVDGPPGVGCPVISAFAGVDHVLIITEATQSGFHDLKRLTELIEFFKAQASCVINKYDLNEPISGTIEEFCNGHSIPVLEKIPFDETFYETLQNGKTIVESENKNLKSKIEHIWQFLKNVEG